DGADTFATVACGTTAAAVEAGVDAGTLGRVETTPCGFNGVTGAAVVTAAGAAAAVPSGCDVTGSAKGLSGCCTAGAGRCVGVGAGSTAEFTDLLLLLPGVVSFSNKTSTKQQQQINKNNIKKLEEK